MIDGIDVVFIHAKNPQELSLWYKNVLGMEIKFQTTDLSWNEFQITQDIPTTRFAIDFPGEKSTGPGLQPIIISFRVKNIHETIKQLEERGVNFYGDKKILDTGITLFASFKDPEGNWLQISQRKEENQ